MPVETSLSTRGFTLVEVLCVIAILGLLSALLFPVLSRAKGAGNRTVDVSNLRQWSAARALYVDSFDNFSEPRDLEPIRITLGTAAPPLISRSDPVEEGVAVRMRRLRFPAWVAPADYPRRSYATWADFDRRAGECERLAEATSGWLLSFLPASADTMWRPDLVRGSYLIARRDTSVVSAAVPWHPFGTGESLGHNELFGCR